ncbi:ribonuclease E/G [Vallitalea pronyensis]|uniref:Ribonuclease E/G n=1 Tax=Vallitalea pronyensis TaxID=1348613 RepID=A0A8J8MKA7_9FIRM|nr:ribonuclease E/G [Vallitalea pronyensis]QUI23432.1 ribonuclease E/G [Vallitalea pronyensis]
MNNQLIIAKDGGKLYGALMDHKQRLVEVRVTDQDDYERIGTIVIGKVVNVLKGMQAAFIHIGEDKNAYMTLENTEDIFFTKRHREGYVTVGDEVVVQITKEALGTKGCVVSPYIALTGRYVVLTRSKNYIGLSNKIKKVEEKNRLKELVSPYVTDDYGFIIRTNAKDISDTLIRHELDELITTYKDIMNTATYRVCYTQIYQGVHPAIKLVRDMYETSVGEYVIDDPEIYSDVKAYMQKTDPSLVEKISLYDDQQITLFNLYGLKAKIHKALQERVWLKSGACLVIQQTEALVVIDVNTAKFTGKKNLEETIFKTNLEAAVEIARQIRLRNLAGIIVVDFIDMKKQENNDALLEKLSLYTKKDPNKVYVVGMTKLGLVEITRKKTNVPLAMQING